MIKKLVCILVAILLTTTIISGIKATEGKIAERGSYIDAIHRSFPYKNSSFDSNNDLIIDIIQDITESLYLAYLENITAFGPRVTGTPSCYNTGTYLYNEFQSMGLAVRYQNWNNGGYQDRNIEATLP